MKNLVLAFEAKSFYNAFINLLNADSISPVPNFFLPTIVNGSFSIELAIKCILTENEIEYNKEHNLLELFWLLPCDFKNEVWKYFLEKAPQYQNPATWCDELILISESFVDYRYCFEKDFAAFDLDFFAAFAYSVFRTLINHYNVELKKNHYSHIAADKIEEMIDQNREDSIKRILDELTARRKRRKK